MKTALLIATFISSSAFASATLNIPLFVEKDNKIIPTAEINKQLKLQGKDKIVEVISIENTGESMTKAHNTFWSESSKVDALAEKLKQNFFLAMDTPGYHKVGKVQTCYTGNPAEAVSIAGQMTDGIYSDQLGIIGYKYKNKMELIDADDSEESLQYLNDNSDLWKNWKSTNEDILILSHEGDGGDDVNEGIFVKCK